jgi:succinate dehydrogenase/fumarate reductase flavoprotein subunit
MKGKDRSNIAAGRKTVVHDECFSSISPQTGITSILFRTSSRRRRDTTDHSPLFFKVIIIGSGTASLNAAVQLKRLGIDDVAIITEGVYLGTSANTGSDKQTYYRLNPCAPAGDSACKMAQDLFSGGSMHGDTALIEAALSGECFAHLCQLGVEFPFNEYGIYPGYRTDHDTIGRATSAGPRTSIMMHEKLLAEARRLGVMIIDGMEVVKILTESDTSIYPSPIPLPLQGEEGRQFSKSADSADSENNIASSWTGGGWGKSNVVKGVVALNNENSLQVILADYVVWGTGGPAVLYADSVYPREQAGSLGVALMAGARACNLTESQFGIASVNPRWNLSGSFQQVLPDYFSCNPDGTEKRHFLIPYFNDWQTMCRMIFLKGYEWPFDVKKIPGSSLIDLLVYQERVELGRKVFMDFTCNPDYSGGRFSIKALPDIVKDYLIKSGATGSTPVRRLIKMNPAAYELYLSKGVDLRKEPLEIAVCNQHLNGGLVVDKWWETGIKNFFAVGEAAGTHGIYRPGGSTLNAGQVGSLRAAQCVAYRVKTRKNTILKDEILEVLEGAIKSGQRINPLDERLKIQKRASATLGIIRSLAGTRKAMAENIKQLQKHILSGVKDRSEIRAWLKNIDLLITERAMLNASGKLLESLKQSRGSFIYQKKANMDLRHFGYVLAGGDSKGRARNDKALTDMVIETWIDKEGNAHSKFVPVRPLPKPDDWFEAVWARFMKGEVFES